MLREIMAVDKVIPRTNAGFKVNILQVTWDDAHQRLFEIEESNSRGLGLFTLPYKTG